MGFFKKKEKEKKVETDVTKNGENPIVDSVPKINIEKDYPYVVQLYDVDGTTSIRREPFGAKRYIEGANVFLVNEQKGFKEPFPDNTDDYLQYKLEEISAKIKDTESKLLAIKKKSSKIGFNTPESLDLLQDLKVFKGYEKSLQLSGKGSYMIIAQDYGGRPLYSFDRKGNFKLPVYKNTDYSLLYIPNETDIALAGDLLKLNEDKNGSHDNSIKLVNLALTVMLVIALCGTLYFAYKTSSLPETVVNGLSELVVNMNDLATNFETIVESQINSTTPDTVNVDDAVQPKTVNVN